MCSLPDEHNTLHRSEDDKSTLQCNQTKHAKPVTGLPDISSSFQQLRGDASATSNTGCTLTPEIFRTDACATQSQKEQQDYLLKLHT